MPSFAGDSVSLLAVQQIAAFRHKLVRVLCTYGAHEHYCNVTVLRSQFGIASEHVVQGTPSSPMRRTSILNQPPHEPQVRPAAR